MRLTILHTNDVHAEYEAWLSCAAFIKKRRSEVGPENCLTLDSGDHFDMSVDECGLSGGRLHLELLADAGVDAFTPGNNEFYRASRETLSSLSLASPFPWLLSTVAENDGRPFAGFRSSLLIERGIRIGLLGALAPMDSAAEELHGLSTLDFEKTFSLEASRLRSQGANLVILLSHCGLEEDIALAKRQKGLFDVIVGGHSHSELRETMVEEGTIIVQAGGFGKFVGELSLDIVDGRVARHEYSLHQMGGQMPGDEDQSRILADYRGRTGEQLARELCLLDRDLSETELRQLAAELLRRKFGADLGIIFEPAVTRGLPKGPLHLGEVYDISRSFITPASFEISGRQIGGLLREGLDPAITSGRGFGIGFRPQGLAFGRLAFSGLEWKEEDGLISDIRIGGSSLDPGHWYLAGSATHLFSTESGGYPSMDGSRDLRPLRFHYLREIFAEHFAGASSRSEVSRSEVS